MQELGAYCAGWRLSRMRGNAVERILCVGAFVEACAGRLSRCDGNPRLAPGCRKSSSPRPPREAFAMHDGSWTARPMHWRRACVSLSSIHASTMDRHCARSRTLRNCRRRNRGRAGRRRRRDCRNVARCAPSRRSSSARPGFSRYPWRRVPGGWSRRNWESARTRATRQQSNRSDVAAKGRHCRRAATHSIADRKMDRIAASFRKIGALSEGGLLIGLLLRGLLLSLLCGRPTAEQREDRDEQK